MPTYEDVNRLESQLSAVETQVILDQWREVVEGNDAVQEWLEHSSQPEVDAMFWLFRQGWLWRNAMAQKCR